VDDVDGGDDLVVLVDGYIAVGAGYHEVLDAVED
jgi:hypothetical protein